MKILYLHQYFNTPAMASSTRSYEMARRLVDYGHEVHMVSSYREQGQIDRKGWFESEEAGIKVHWLPVPYSNMMSYRERVVSFLKFASRAAIKAASIECDVIYATSTPLTIALPAIYAARKHKVPMVFEVRDLWPELPIAIGAIKNPLLIMAAKELERFAYRNASFVVALSPGIKEGIIRAGFPAEKIIVIPNSCDLELFQTGSKKDTLIRAQYDWLQDRPLVLYAGTIGRINGVEYLARLAGVIERIDQDVRFLVIGSGFGEKKLREEAKKLGVLDKNFFILPRVPKRNIPEWLAAADIATSLFIDLEEMWSNSANKLFDALAAGKPVAINYGGWQSHILEESGAGIVLNPKDIESSAETLVEKIKDNNWLSSAGHAARELAESSFDRNILALEINKVLLDSVESYKPKHGKY